VILGYVEAHKDRFGIEPICRVLTEHGLPIAPSTVHQRVASPVSPAELADAYAANTLLDLHRANRGVYGVRKLWHTARRAGHDWGRDQVGRLMGIAGIDGVRRGRHSTVTTTRQQAAPRHPDLIDRAWATPSRPDQWWVADFTYVWTLARFVYVSFVTDVYSRRILGWRVSTSKTTPLVSSALEQALFTRRRGNVAFTATGLVHHSDAGSQGGLNRSSQRLDLGGVDGQTSRVDEGADGPVADEVAGSSFPATGCRAAFLARGRQGIVKRGSGSGGRRVGRGRQPMVPRAWRHADVHARAGHRTVLVV